MRLFSAIKQCSVRALLALEGVSRVEEGQFCRNESVKQKEVIISSGLFHTPVNRLLPKKTELEGSFNADEKDVFQVYQKALQPE